jgi:hypothetical protein
MAIHPSTLTLSLMMFTFTVAGSPAGESLSVVLRYSAVSDIERVFRFLSFLSARYIPSR